MANKKIPPPPPTKPQNSTWEYKVEAREPEVAPVCESVLNMIGAQGWELMSVLPHGGKILFFFKRRKK